MFVHAIEYCSAFKKNEVLINTTKWMNLENIGERSQRQKAAWCVIPFVSRMDKPIETESTSVITKAGGMGE